MLQFPFNKVADLSCEFCGLFKNVTERLPATTSDGHLLYFKLLLVSKQSAWTSCGLGLICFGLL